MVGSAGFLLHVFFFARTAKGIGTPFAKTSTTAIEKVFSRASSSQRDGKSPYRARFDRERARRYMSLASHARRRGDLGAGVRSRRNRDAIRSGEKNHGRRREDERTIGS